MDHSPETLKTEIQRLGQQVGALQQALADLCLYLAVIAEKADAPPPPEPLGNRWKRLRDSVSQTSPEEVRMEELLIHKDILPDEALNSPWLGDGHPTPLSCDQQLHRLSAQLTVAYHRIAVLEEQLLAWRSQAV
ncbi:MAG: hypothetical protein ACK5CA_10115 [Cyanobacteriota bacterium]